MGNKKNLGEREDDFEKFWENKTIAKSHILT